MGNFDGAKIVEFIGIRILSSLTNKPDKYLLTYIGKMSWYFQEAHQNRKQTKYEET